MSTKVHRTVFALSLTALMAVSPVTVLAQNAPLPPRMHSGPTMMSAKAHQMADQTSADIAAAKSKGVNVKAAESYKSKGDQALNTGHWRIAVDEYEAAQKALKPTGH